MLGIKNDLALSAQTHLNRANQAWASNQEQLASGKRVNHAADDPASIALITQFAAQITENGQGMRNISDGISLAQTAEAGVGEVNDAMQRIRELSIQSANGTLAAPDRAALQAEVKGLQEQVAKTMESTSFNGIALLNQDEGIVIRAGSKTSDSIAIETGNVQSQLSTLGFDDIDISTTEGAASALEVLDQASEYLGGVRGGLGAVQNRFEAAVRGLETAKLNSASAQSQIQDTDYARQTAEQTRNMIKQQAAIAMLGQANASSTMVEQLLRNH